MHFTFGRAIFEEICIKKIKPTVGTNHQGVGTLAIYNYMDTRHVACPIHWREHSLLIQTSPSNGKKHCTIASVTDKLGQGQGMLHDYLTTFS